MFKHWILRSLLFSNYTHSFVISSILRSLCHLYAYDFKIHISSVDHSPKAQMNRPNLLDNIMTSISNLHLKLNKLQIVVPLKAAHPQTCTSQSITSIFYNLLKQDYIASLISFFLPHSFHLIHQEICWIYFQNTTRFYHCQCC